jgi:hypothetical protein
MGHPSFNWAEELARAAHAGQTEADGSPYVEHPLRVARAVAAAGGDATAVVVALLHDSVEKGGATWDELRAAGVDGDVLTAVDAITQRSGEDVWVYLERCRAHPLAREVKRHDLLDKLHPERLGSLPGAEACRVTRAAGAKLAWLDGRP